MKLRLKTGEVLIVDESDAHLLGGFVWRVRYRFAGNERVAQYVYGINGSIKIMLHRLIMRPARGVFIDHIDRNPLNNSRSNLRECSRAENARNRRMHRNNKVGLKGVYLSKERWRAQIRVDGRKIDLGRFDSPTDAHAAYVLASDRYHGKFGATA